MNTQFLPIAEFLRTDAEDQPLLLLRTRSGATGCLQVCLSAWHGTGWNFQVYGSEGMLMIRDEPAAAAGGVQGDPRKVHVALHGARSGDPGLQRIEPDPAHCRVQGIGGTNFAVAQMWVAFGECIRSGRDCHPDFADEVVMHRLWEAAERSMQGGGWVDVPA